MEDFPNIGSSPKPDGHTLSSQIWSKKIVPGGRDKHFFVPPEKENLKGANRYLRVCPSILEGFPNIGKSSNLITYFSTITFFCWHDIMGNSIMSNWKSSQILEWRWENDMRNGYLIFGSSSNIWKLFQFDIMLFPITSYQQKKVIALK